MSQILKNLPLVLLILDGFGIAAPSRGNAVSQSKMPVYNDLARLYPFFSVAAAGEAVGLPWGEPGNSEVGHLNLGAGKIVYQPVLRINKSIEDETFFENEALAAAVAHCKKHNSSLHFMGLLSDGGVHSHQDHLYALLEMASRASLNRVYIHVFLDGRDTAPDSGLEYVKQLEKVSKRLKVGSIATISGRFYAMDRDNHWDRVEKVYAAIAKGEAANQYESATDAIKESYKNGIFDEEFIPCTIKTADINGSARVQPGDSLVCFNYRPDRAREITKAFTLPTFVKFTRTAISNLNFVTLTEYEEGLPVSVAFKKEAIDNPLAKVLSDAELNQLHIAETEKYAHVTYFFNGGSEVVYKGQENIIVPSAGVASYAEKPEMSAYEILDKLSASIKAGKNKFFVANFANPDMVGHTGDLRATIQALAHCDKVIAKIASLVGKLGGVVVITSDHGNAEEMVNWENGHIVKEHSSNPVPCLIIGEQFKLKTPKPKDFLADSLKITGVLSDISPTILSIIGLPIPPDMTSRSLV